MMCYYHPDSGAAGLERQGLRQEPKDDSCAPVVRDTPPRDGGLIGGWR